MVHFTPVWLLALITFIILFNLIECLEQTDKSIIHKRAISQDVSTHNTSKPQQTTQPPIATDSLHRKKRKWGVITPLTEEQKQLRNKKVREYKRKLTFKGLKEAKQTMSPEAYAKLEKSAERQRKLQKNYKQAYLERKKKKENSILTTSTTIKKTPAQLSEGQIYDIQKANRAADAQISSRPSRLRIHDVDANKSQDPQVQQPDQKQRDKSL